MFRSHFTNKPNSNDLNSKLLETLSLFNIQGLKPLTVQSTVPLVFDLLHNKNSLFITLTETWLTNHYDAELIFDGYQIFRSDRLRPKKKYGRHSGGVALYIRNEISSTFKQILTFSNGVNEVLSVYSEQENMFITVIY